MCFGNWPWKYWCGTSRLDDRSWMTANVTFDAYGFIHFLGFCIGWFMSINFGNYSCNNCPLWMTTYVRFCYHALIEWEGKDVGVYMCIYIACMYVSKSFCAVTLWSLVLHIQGSDFRVLRQRAISRCFIRILHYKTLCVNSVEVFKVANVYIQHLWPGWLNICITYSSFKTASKDLRLTLNGNIWIT